MGAEDGGGRSWKVSPWARAWGPEAKSRGSRGSRRRLSRLQPQAGARSLAPLFSRGFLFSRGDHCFLTGLHCFLGMPEKTVGA